MFDGVYRRLPSVEQLWDWAGAAIGFSVAPAWLIVNTAHHCPEPCLLYICRSPTHVKSIDERSELIGKLGALFTFDTFQLLSGWLKEVANANILFISSTLNTSHLLSGWLKSSASPNIRSI